MKRNLKTPIQFQVKSSTSLTQLIKPCQTKQGSLVVEDEWKLAADVIGPVVTEKAGGKVERGAVRTLDGADSSVAVVSLAALVPQAQRVPCILLYN